ncbi:MAG: zinc ribbon domain-containing protein, partial [Candidatus Gastranaerophilales bacterium]|nr:zinc ribbon domain-containing protein [Candidatus Gastranaerophilales bacterium]
MKCPKCKKENDNNALVCSECGFKLQLKCPYCGSYNYIGAKTCSSCNQQLLKTCPACKAVNFSQAKVCRKCSTPFSTENGKNIPVATPLLTKSACVAIELINISSIKNNIKSQEIAQKVIAKFYQIFAKTAKKSNVKALKINENTLVASFDNSSSFLDSVNDAVEFTEQLDTSLDEVSQLLESKLKVSYKVRYFIGTFKPQQKLEITSAIALGVVDDIIFSEDVYVHLKDRMLFKEIENNLNGKYYKFLDQNDPETIVSELPKEPLIKNRTEIVGELVNKVEMAKEGFVVCLNGITGIGKSNIFNALKMTFDEDNSRIWLTGQCPFVSKNSPLAFFKSLLQNLFDIPVFNIDIENTKNKVTGFLNDKLSITDINMVNHILSVILINESDINNPLYQNKQNTYVAIATLFKSLLSKGSTVLQIEDIENIDNFSLEILRNLFDDGILKCDLKIFVTSNMDIDIIQFFANPQSPRLKEFLSKV